MLDVMVLNEKENEKLVIDLLKEGHTTREISKMANVSNTTIKKINKKLQRMLLKRKSSQRINHCLFRHRHSIFFWRASPLSRLP
jgi:DNA invertase Pin-like site-specific DNA recombinase